MLLHMYQILEKKTLSVVLVKNSLQYFIFSFWISKCGLTTKTVTVYKTKLISSGQH